MIGRFKSERLHHLIVIFPLVFILNNSANANYFYALDALHAKDGNRLIEEVRQSVRAKDNHGLILFISALIMDVTTSQRESFFFTSNSVKNLTEYSKGNSSLGGILGEHEKVELFQLLQSATKSSSLQSQYRLAIFKYKLNKNNEEYLNALNTIFNNGYAPAGFELFTQLYLMRSLHKTEQFFNKVNENELLDKLVSMGHPYAAFILAMQYTNKPVFGCGKQNNCKKFDPDNAWTLMQKAALNADELNLPFSDYANEMGNFYRSGTSKLKPNLNEAFLWFQQSANNKVPVFSDPLPEANIADMYHRGELKNVAPELHASWNEISVKEAIIYPNSFIKLPTLILEQRIADSKEKPVISLYRFGKSGPASVNFDSTYMIDIYENGEVKFLLGGTNYGEKNNETVWEISKEDVSDIVSRLYKMGFDKWQLQDKSKNNVYFSESREVYSYYITQRDGSNNRTVARHCASFEMCGHDIAHVIKIIEDKFPTKSFRCELGSSNSFHKECNDFERKILSIEDMEAK